MRVVATLENVERALRLGRDECADEEREEDVAVIALVGALRTGKSTVAAALAQHLRGADALVLPRRRDQDQHQTTTTTTRDFEWGWGRRPVTRGVRAERFTLPAPSPSSPASEKKNVRHVVLLDVQGLWDSTLGQESTLRLFALAVMLSSVVVYNVEKRVSEDVLQHAAMFGDYARAVANSVAARMEPNATPNSTTPFPFQHLEFLVRDWEHFSEPTDDALKRGETRQFDEECGAYTTETLAARSWGGDRLAVRDAITSAFRRVSVRMLPHPGLEVTRPAFDGDLRTNATPAFQTALRHWLASTLSTVEPKRLPNGRALTLGELPRFISSFAAALNASASAAELPPALTLLEATALANNATSLEAAWTLFTRQRDAALQRRRKPEDEALATATQAALALFDARATFGPRELASESRAELEARIDAWVTAHRAAVRKRRVAQAAAAVAVSATAVVATSTLTVPLIVPAWVAASASVRAAFMAVRVSLWGVTRAVTTSATIAASATTTASTTSEAFWLAQLAVGSVGASLVVSLVTWAWRSRSRST